MRRLFGLVLTFALILSVACGWRLQKKLEGRWANKYGSNAWNFTSGGTIDVIGKEPGGDKLVATGSYKVMDSETIEIRWADTPSKQDRIKIRFNDSGGMILTLPDNSQRVFVKVN